MTLDLADDDGATPVVGSRRRLVLSGLLLGTLLAALDQTIVSTALPTIVGELGGGTHLSWVVTAYLLATTATTPLWGKLGDLYGRRRVFEAAIVLFLVGSLLCAASRSMTELILARAVQGLGGGGAIIGAQAMVADVVPPRERGRYQGLFGAVFATSSVAGPLLGGVFVDQLSWRWAFGVNVPLGVVVLVLVATTFPDTSVREQRVIDYAGAVLVIAATTCLILFVSWGGTSLPWASLPSIGLALVGGALLAGFVVVERRAVEPVLPWPLLRNRVFAVTGAIGFVVGFALYGATTFLPLFLQVVRGASATGSGLAMLPMTAGLLSASMASGHLMTRWGRYKPFPVAGTAATALGLFGMSRLDASSGFVETAAPMFLLGVGLGAVMQVLVAAVQNAVSYPDIGAATAGNGFLRSVGSSFGVAVFGAILSNLLTRALPAPPTGTPGDVGTPQAVAALPAGLRDAYVDAYTTAFQTVFAVAVPVALVAFLLSLLLPDEPLRTTGSASGLAEAFGAGCDRTPLQEVEKALCALTRTENQPDLYRRLGARAGVSLDPAGAWLTLRLEQHPEATSVDALSRRLGVPAIALVGPVDQLVASGVVRGDRLALTPAGRTAAGRLVAARREGLIELLDGWSPEQYPELAEGLEVLAARLLIDDPVGTLLSEAGRKR